jgi:hypothetical protein
MTTTIDERIDRLSKVSAKRVIEPDEAVVGHIGEGPVIPAELLSVAGLDLGLTPEQISKLAREEVASITESGVRFEAILTAGFAMDIAMREDVTDPRVVYMLHEMGEETRHSRLFIRLLEQLAPTARNPFAGPALRAVQLVVLPVLMRSKALFCLLVLTGEEVPDLLQKITSEHPDTDGFIRAINRYHRQEEARHLAFARTILPEAWSEAGRVERWAVRHLAPRIVGTMFDALVHPGVYATVGLPAWKTWRAVARSPQRKEVRFTALRPLVAALIEADALAPGAIPKAWRRLCGVDGNGEPLSAGVGALSPAA